MKTKKCRNIYDLFSIIEEEVGYKFKYYSIWKSNIIIDNKDEHLNIELKYDAKEKLKILLKDNIFKATFGSLRYELKIVFDIVNELLYGKEDFDIEIKTEIVGEHKDEEELFISWDAYIVFLNDKIWSSKVIVYDNDEKLYINMHDIADKYGWFFCLELYKFHLHADVDDVYLRCKICNKRMVSYESSYLECQRCNLKIKQSIDFKGKDYFLEKTKIIGIK